MARMTRTRDLYIPEGAQKHTFDDLPGTEVYFYDHTGFPALLIFGGRAQKPTLHKYYGSKEKREKRLEDWLAAARAKKASVAARRKEAAQGHTLKVGDLLVNTWGYSMTIVDYYRVVKTTKCTVTLQAIRSKDAGGGDGFGQCGNVTPAPELGDKDERQITVRCGPDNSPRMKHGWARQTKVGDTHYFNSLD